MSSRKSNTQSDQVDELLRQAIDQNRLVRFKYLNRWRIAEPHDYGVQNGRIRLLSYQVRGESTGPLPNWRWIEVPGISNLEVMEDTFSGNRPSTKHHTWDQVFARAKERPPRS